MDIPHKRVILKITGEALKGEGHIFDEEKLEKLANEIRSVYRMVELAIVIGGGNIVRGSYLTKNFDTTAPVADYIGMTATVMNALLLEDFLSRHGMDTRVLSAIQINAVAEPYVIKRVKRHLEKGRVAILAGGTGGPGVTTDTAAVLRAYDVSAGIVMKGTKVDGVFDSDPNKNAQAKHLPELTYQEFIERDLAILDETAVAQAKMKKIPIMVFNIFRPGNLLRAMKGENVGSIIR